MVHPNFVMPIMFILRWDCQGNPRSTAIEIIYKRISQIKINNITLIFLVVSDFRAQTSADIFD
jgi:hypothetical protein